jgi:hypothetical protein
VRRQATPSSALARPLARATRRGRGVELERPEAGGKRGNVPIHLTMGGGASLHLRLSIVASCMAPAWSQFCLRAR